MDFNVSVFGIDTGHAPSHVVDRPHGLGSYVLMCFSTPFTTDTVDGRKTGRPGDCLIHDPEFPQWHSSVPGAADGFRNDWLHLDGDGFRGFLARYDLPLNRILPAGTVHLMTPYLYRIQDEFHRREPFWKEAICHQVDGILLHLSRRLAHCEMDRGSAGDKTHRDAVASVRMRVHQDLSRRWSVDAMARFANLSPSRFSVLYRMFYGISPMEDLMLARVEQAKWLLTNAAVSVTEVSEACGFSSIYYFSRFFRQRVGCSPSGFQNRDTTGKANGR